MVFVDFCKFFELAKNRLDEICNPHGENHVFWIEPVAESRDEA